MSRRSRKSIFATLLLCTLVVSRLLAATPAPASASWIWFPEEIQPKTTRYFRTTVTIDAPIDSAVFHLAADDFAFFYINNKPANPLGFGIGTKKADLTRQLRQGANILAFQVNNSAGAAGLLVYGEIIYKDRRIQRIVTDATWESGVNPPADFPPPPPGSSRPAPVGDTIPWAPARVIGTVEDARWAKLITPALFRDQGPATREPIPAQNLGKIVLDDFSDASSWLGSAVRGHPPGSGRPFPFSFGSAADPRRDDGYHGQFVFQFVSPNGQARFEKNAALLLKATPNAVEFDANPLGHEAEVAFEFIDKRNKLFRSAPVSIAGNAWKRHRMEMDAATFPEFKEILFPIALRYIHFTVRNPAEGRILIDDIVYEGDVTRHGGPLSARPNYTGISHAPGSPLNLSYRVRNRQAVPITSEWNLDLFDAYGRKVTSRRATLTAPGHALTPLTFNLPGSLPLGPYRTELSLAGASELAHFGWLGVFTPNGQRINRSPMWFAVEDQEINNAPGETSLHVEWMRALGVDLIRSGMEGWMLENVPGGRIGFDGYSKLLQPHFDAGIDVLLDYSGASSSPGWTKNPPTPSGEFRWNPDRFREHMTSIGQFIARHPRIKYFEFLNEPDLPHRPPHLMLDHYLENLRIVYETLKSHAPDLKVTTGGVTVNHGRAMPGFTQGMYQQGKDYYDIAAWHCHATPEDYEATQIQVLGMLAQAGKNAPLGQTEAGARSYQRDPALFIRQAEVLVKKLAMAKSGNSEFYVWFMLQDYWDKYINADDSFGLVTVDNQPKPSFIAYNELIRQLANTQPASTPLQLDPRLDTRHYQSETEDIFVCWPRYRQAPFLALNASAPVTHIDIWGNTKRLTPSHGIINHNSSSLPFYLRAPRGAVTPSKPLANIVGDAVLAPGETRKLEVEVNNPVNTAIRGTLKAGDKTISINLAPLAGRRIQISATAPSGAAVGARNLDVSAQVKTQGGEPVYAGTISLPYNVCLVIPRGSGPSVPYAFTSPQEAPQIVLESVANVRELAFDPHTPRWAGPEDLSARVRITWDNHGLRVRALIRDQDIRFPRSEQYAWLNDCLQIAILGSKGDQTEITLTKDAKGQTTVWGYISSKQNLLGAWDIPATVEAASGQINYDVVIPFEKIGMRGERGETFKLSLAIVDNDGGRRLRVIEWGGGIQDDKNPAQFNWARLD